MQARRRSNTRSTAVAREKKQAAQPGEGRALPYSSTSLLHDALSLFLFLPFTPSLSAPPTVWYIFFPLSFSQLFSTYHLSVHPSIRPSSCISLQPTLSVLLVPSSPLSPYYRCQLCPGEGALLLCEAVRGRDRRGFLGLVVLERGLGALGQQAVEQGMS